MEIQQNNRVENIHQTKQDHSKSKGNGTSEKHQKQKQKTPVGTELGDCHYDVNGDIYASVVKDGKVYKPPETKDNVVQKVANLNTQKAGNKQKGKSKKVDPLYSDLDFIKEQVKANQLSASKEDLTEPDYEEVPFTLPDSQTGQSKSPTGLSSSSAASCTYPTSNPTMSTGQPTISASYPAVRRLQTSDGRPRVRSSATCLSMYERTDDEDIINQEQDAILNQRNVLQELVDTEKEYIDVLGVLMKGVKEMDATVNKDKKLRQYGFTELIMSLDRIHDLHIKYMLPDLHTKFTVVTGEPLFAETFNKLGPFFKIYQSYASQLGLHYANISYLTEHNKKIADQLQCIDSSPDFEHLSLEEHMLEPIQRIPAYKVMLEKYKKYLSPTGEEHKKTLDALKYLNEENQKFEEIISNQDSFRESMNVARRLTGIDGVVLVNTRRRFIMEGEVMCVEAKQKKATNRHLFLFSDTLLVCMQANRHGKHQFVYSLQLDDVQACGTYVQKIGSSVAVPRKHFLLFQTSRRQLLLNFKSQEIKTSWIRELHLPLAKYGYTDTSSEIETTQPKVLGDLQVSPVWLPDEFAERCMECSSNFSFAKRKRGNCSTCGRLVCSKCCAYEIYLPFGKFKAGRACGKCFLYTMNSHPQLIKAKEKLSRTRSIEQEFNDNLQQRKESSVPQGIEASLNDRAEDILSSGKTDRNDYSVNSSSESGLRNDNMRIKDDFDDNATVQSLSRKGQTANMEDPTTGTKTGNSQSNVKCLSMNKQVDTAGHDTRDVTDNSKNCLQTEMTTSTSNGKYKYEPPYATIGEMVMPAEPEEPPKQCQVPVKKKHHYDIVVLPSEIVHTNAEPSENSHKFIKPSENERKGNVQQWQVPVKKKHHYETIVLPSEKNNKDAETSERETHDGASAKDRMSKDVEIPSDPLVKSTRQPSILEYTDIWTDPDVEGYTEC